MDVAAGLDLRVLDQFIEGAYVARLMPNAGTRLRQFLAAFRATRRSLEWGARKRHEIDRHPFTFEECQTIPCLDARATLALAIDEPPHA